MKWIVQLWLGIVLMSRAAYTFPQLAAENDVALTPEETTVEITSTEPLPPTSTLDPCQDKDREQSGPCTYCYCDEWSSERRWYCAVADCFYFSECVNPVSLPGQCCPVCPDGPNCYIDGKIVPLGEVVETESGRCHCEQRWYFGGELEAVCEPYTTASLTPPPPCQDPPPSSRCSPCECNENTNWQWQCAVIDCLPLLCVDPVLSDNNCCGICPNGPNCQSDNETVLVGQSVPSPDGSKCWCTQSNPWEMPQLLCEPPTPSTTTKEINSCLEPPPKDGPCHECWCVSPTEGWQCAIKDCAQPICSNPTFLPGECCGFCPGDEELPSPPIGCPIEDVILKIGDVHQKDNGDVCYCAENSTLNCSPPLP